MAPTHLLDDSEKHPPKRAKSSNTSTPRTIPLDNTPFTVEYLNKSKDILNREAQELPEFLHSRYLAEIEKKEGERHRQYTITPIEEWREMTEVDSVTIVRKDKEVCYAKDEFVYMRTETTRNNNHNMLIASDEMRVVNVQTFAGPADVVQWSEGYPPESLFWKDFQDAGELLKLKKCCIRYHLDPDRFICDNPLCALGWYKDCLQEILLKRYKTVVEGIEGAAGGQPRQGDISVEILEDGPILRAKITGLQADPKLAEIKDVSCPNCGTVISLEDQTDRGTELPEQSTPDIPKPFEWKNRQEVRHLQGKLEEAIRKEANMQVVLGRLVAVRNDCNKLESKSYAHSHRVVLESLFKCSKNGGQAGCPHLQGKLEEAIREEQDVQDVPGHLLAACRNHCKQLEGRLYAHSHRVVLESLVKWVKPE